jgi:hypothetical protein
MSQSQFQSFPSDVADKLRTYVYRLIDPRNGETFYVGKEQGNRVFAHIRAEETLDGDDSTTGWCAYGNSRSLDSKFPT